jgi:glycosyltransferase involved in cell wall biosynthesis
MGTDFADARIVQIADEFVCFRRAADRVIEDKSRPHVITSKDLLGSILASYRFDTDRVPRSLRLVVAGDGIERGSLELLAAQLGIADRVIFTGRVAPESVLGTFDIFALSSDTEQMPNALLEAMAASRAIAAVDVGDVKTIVCEENREFIVSRDDGPAFAAAITGLLHSPEKRATLGAMNRLRAITEYSQERMFSAYSKIFSAACAG